MAERQDVIVWLDPGLTTGAAWWDEEAEIFHSGEYTADQLMRGLEALAVLYPGRLVVGYEQYIVTGGGGAVRGTPKHSLGVIAQVEEAVSAGLFRLLPPVPSSARNLGNPVYLKRLGWHKPGKGHANDACQHLVAHLIRQKPMSPFVKRKLFPGYNPGATISI